MGNLSRFCVVGSHTVNNYYIVYTYLKQYLPREAIIITGGAQGVDMLANVYADLNGHPCEVYEPQWEIFGNDANKVKNVNMLRNSDHLIAFWDGSSPTTKHIIDEARRMAMHVVVIDVTDDDIVRPHPGRVVHVNKEPFDVYIGRPYKDYVGTLGNPYKLDANTDRYKLVAMFTDYLLKSKEMLRDVVALYDQKSKIDGGPLRLGCWCADGTETGPICHGDMICWLLDHEYGELKRLAYPDNGADDTVVGRSTNKAKKPLLQQEVVESRWPVTGGRTPVCTTLGLSLANGHTSVVQDEYGRWFIEVSDLDIIRDHIHMSLSEYNQVDQEPTRLWYRSNDRTKTCVMEQLVEFDSSVFRKGYWYIKVDDLVKEE